MLLTIKYNIYKVHIKVTEIKDNVSKYVIMFHRLIIHIKLGLFS